MKYFGHTSSAVHESDLDNELLNLIRVPHWMYDQNMYPYINYHQEFLYNI